jgi:perosamine synthetase
MNFQIKRINKEKVAGLLPDLLSLEYNWTGINEAAWEQKNFTMDLPSKWELSFYADVHGKIAGYMIGSVDQGIGKLNKMVVDRNFRKLGIATALWKAFASKCKAKNIGKIKFRALVNNTPAVKFYQKMGAVINGTTKGSDGRLRHDITYVLKAKSQIRHSKPSITESDCNAVAQAIRTCELATGNIAKKFGEQLAKYIGRKYALTASSGSTALHLALRALGVGAGDEVILPSYVCNSVISSVSQCGAKPVLADINADDYNISFEDTKKKISAKTKAIIVPHMFGKPVKDIEAFMQLGIPIVEDCAISIGAVHNGKKIGNFGIVSIFSFYATKMLTTGTGGAILTNDRKIFQKLADLTNYDQREKFGEAYNYRMADFNAALGISQLKKLDSFVKRRKQIARSYNQILSRNIELKLPNARENIFFRYVIEHPEPEALIRNAKKRGIQAERPVFRPLHNYLKISNDYFPNSARAFETAISLPIYPSLAEAEIEDIAGIIINWKNEN